MSQQKKLMWNPTQVQIYELLNQGIIPSKIAKQLGVAKSTITKVSSAMKKGQSPATPYMPHPKKSQYYNPPAKVKNNGEAELGNTTENLVSATKNNLPPTGDASVLDLKPVAIPCAITPIMLTARYVAVTEMGWPADVNWEDFLDTCLVYCFKYWGYKVQPFYKLGEKQ